MFFRRQKGNAYLLRDRFLGFKLRFFGYVKMPVLPDKVTDALLSYINEKNVTYLNGIYNSVVLNDVALRHDQDRIIRAQIAAYLDKYLVDYKIIFSTYFLKRKAVQNTVGFHQDPTSVDYQNFDDFTLWFPLVDTDKTGTGRIQVSRFSHNQYSKLNFSDYVFFHEYLKSFNGRLTTLNLRKGEPVLFYNNLIHASEVNNVFDNRPAITIKITNKDAKITVYHVVNWEKRIIDMYRTDDELYYVKNGWDESQKPLNASFYKRITIPFD